MSPQSILIYAVLIFILDIPWLWFNQSFAVPMIRAIQGSPVEVRLWSAGVTYLFLAYLLHQAKSVQHAFFLGCAVYGVYDFTNYATFKNYKLEFAIADTLWGGVLMAGAFWISRRFLK